MTEILFTVGEAAKAANLTAETLRHYDRTGLVKPSFTDPWTKYRRYSEGDVVRLNTVAALRNMGMPLKDIRELLACDDMEKIVEGFGCALRRADAKIAELQEAKLRIERAKKHYENKMPERSANHVYVKSVPQRAILLSDNLTVPTVDNLYDYHRHFYAQVGEERRHLFSFEDEAGIYSRDGVAKMFAVCSRYSDDENMLILPAGKYLCADCGEQTREAALANLTVSALEEYACKPTFAVSMIRLTGILQWRYELQLLVESDDVLPNKT